VKLPAIVKHAKIIKSAWPAERQSMEAAIELNFSKSPNALISESNQRDGTVRQE
jgi:hypothetical protein